MRHFRLFLAVTTLLLSGLTLEAGAQTVAPEIETIADAVNDSGSFLDGQSLESVAADAVERANAEGVGFVYLDQENGADLELIADDLLQQLTAIGSQYETLITLDASGVYVVSNTNDAAAAAADAATPDFARGAIAGGIDTVLNILNGGAEVATTNSNEASTGTTSDASSDSSGGVPWLLILFLGLAAFLAVRFFTGRRRKAAALEKEMQEDRAEIREQLRNNADHVIDLGDRITTADDDIRRIYEEAAQTFQDVSLGLDDASTPTEIDALDDRLDRAEWQFDVIEARLDGRTPPPEPRIGEGPIGRSATRPGARQPVPPLGNDRSVTDRGASDRPAMDADESLFPGRSTGRAPQRRQPTPRRRGGGSMLGGVVKGGLMALVIKMLLGGGLSLGGGSRRTQQRRSSNSGGGFGGGVGGGVLR